MTPTADPNKILKVPTLDQPQRLDKFLTEQFPHSSRNYWREHLETTVRVDGRRARKSQQLRGGEQISLNPPPPEQKPPLQPNPDLPFSLIYEDSALLAINKPAGLPCLPLKAAEKETVANALLAHFPEQAQVDPESWEAGMIHRLDNETSGVLLFARKPEVKAALVEMNRRGEISKEYLAWVEGMVLKDGVVQYPIGHHPKNKAKMVLALDEKEARKFKARPAISEYQVLEHVTGFTLLKVKIQKGARHQIRLHLAHLGHPVAGDKLYGNPPGETPQPMLHLLHASQVQLSHPLTQRPLTLSAPPPEDFSPLP